MKFKIWVHKKAAEQASTVEKRKMFRNLSVDLLSDQNQIVYLFLMWNCFAVGNFTWVEKEETNQLYVYS